MEIQDYQKIISDLIKKKRRVSLLMGNGFSVAFNPNIFTYNALANFLASKSDPLINKLFSTINTKNFELIMQQLSVTRSLLVAFNADKTIIENIDHASLKLKEGLINSIQEMHPEHVFKVEPEKSNCCFNFLKFFIESGGDIFTTNYDLLLYWVLMRNIGDSDNYIDGFGKELNNPDYAKNNEEPDWSDLIWGKNCEKQNIHYLHGALHIFNEKIDIKKECYTGYNFLLENIKSKINSGNYPIFVTAGSSEDKLEHIRSNRYLNHCYEKLSGVDGSVVTFGFNFGEYDEHIIGALNKAFHQNHKKSPKLRSIYIGTYCEKDIDHIKSIEHKFSAPIRIFDAKSAPAWNKK